MNSELKKRAAWWMSVYEYHNEDLTAGVAMAYAKDSQHLSAAELSENWKAYRANHRKAPMPCDLNGEERKAQQVAHNIWKSLHWSRWPKEKDNMGFSRVCEKDVYFCVGPITTQVMLLHGGFNKMVKRVGELNEHFAKKDWERDAKFVMNQIRSGKSEMLKIESDKVDSELQQELANVVELKTLSGGSDETSC